MIYVCLAERLLLTKENQLPLFLKTSFEGEAYARKLDESRVKVTANPYNGIINDWGLLNALSTLYGTQSALLQAAAEIKKALK